MMPMEQPFTSVGGPRPETMPTGLLGTTSIQTMSPTMFDSLPSRSLQ